MAKLGNVEASVILCNGCGKRISIKGIKIQKKQKEEYQVTFFSCPHCGRVYQIDTTDERQRELLQLRAEAMRRALSAAGIKSLQKTARDSRKKAKALEKKLRRRVERLRAIGEEILQSGSEGEADGSENGDRGAEGVQGN